MKISQALEKVKQLQNLIDNLKKLQKYAIENSNKISSLEKKINLNTTIDVLLIDILDEIASLKGKIEKVINDTEINDILLR